MIIMKCKECGKGCKHPIYEHWIKYQLCAECNGNMKAYDVPNHITPKKVTSKHLRQRLERMRDDYGSKE